LKFGTVVPALAGKLTLAGFDENLTKSILASSQSKEDVSKGWDVFGFGGDLALWVADDEGVEVAFICQGGVEQDSGVANAVEAELCEVACD
jgi:hypothetical protein